MTDIGPEMSCRSTNCKHGRDSADEPPGKGHL